MRRIALSQWLLLGALTLALGIPFLIVGIFVPGRTRKGQLFRLLSKSYSRILFCAFRVRLAVSGLDRIDPRSAYVFMANHTSLADAPACAVAIPQPLHFVFKKELARIPVFGWAILALGQVMVDRENREQARRAIEKMASELSGNSSIIIFPEGRVSRDGFLQPLKKGGFHLALQTGLPIVPLRVSGAREVCPPGGTARVYPGVVSIEMFPPIPVRGLTQEDIPSLMEAVRRCLDSPFAGIS